MQDAPNFKTILREYIERKVNIHVLIMGRNNQMESVADLSTDQMESVADLSTIC